MDTRETRSRDIQVSIRRVLLREWDPIGMRDVLEAKDEYDGYVGGVYRLLANGASTLELAEHLARIERDDMGFSTVQESLPAVADRLKQLDITLAPT